MSTSRSPRGSRAARGCACAARACRRWTRVGAPRARVAISSSRSSSRRRTSALRRACGGCSPSSRSNARGPGRSRAASPSDRARARARARARGPVEVAWGLVVFVDIQHREVTLKLVYYGPALSGKTTNLQQLHALVGDRAGTGLMTLNTRDDRTLFFDLLPLHLTIPGGLDIKIKLFTVPGQVFHAATRRIVLQGADGVVFVADSRIS